MLLEQPTEHIPVTVPSEVPAIPFESNVPKERFFGERAQSEGIHRSGDIIQVVGSQRFSTRSRPLRSTSIAPRARSILRPICSCSNWQALPGRRIAGDSRALRKQKVEIRRLPARGRAAKRRSKTWPMSGICSPIQGTAEHVMLVDLARNDLGRVCDYAACGSKT